MKIPTTMEMRIVALLAQGQTYDFIQQHVEKDFGHKVSFHTISRVKRRNADSLALITDTVAKQEEANSKGILNRSRRLLTARMAKMESDIERSHRIDQDFLAGKLTPKEYMVEKSNIQIPTLTELNAVSKEAFNQSRVESGAGENSNSLSADPQKRLQELSQIVKEGDEVILERIVFGVKSEQSTTAVLSNNEG